MLNTSDHIKVYENVLTLPALSSLIRSLNYLYDKNLFEPGKVLAENPGQQLAPSIRDVMLKTLDNCENSITSQHWGNLLKAVFSNALKEYRKEYNVDYLSYNKILEVTALRYQQSQHYGVHTDDHWTIPRTLSLIYMLNNDYEGGSLKFYVPGSKTEILKEIETKANQLIVWPSNFIYPHTVTPVTKGIRWVIVSWIR
jgi:hypothetical protein